MSKPNSLDSLITSYSDKNDVDLFILNAGMDYGVDKQVINLVCERERRSKVCLFLVTEGGDANIAYRIARCFQRHYEQFEVVVAGWCKSAGTLICIGANKLIIGDEGELGPLDVQLAKPDDIGGRSSGLAIESAFDTLQSTGSFLFQRFLFDIILKTGGRITTKTSAELSVSLVTGLLSPIFQQIDPLKIGEDFRSTQIAEAYAERLSGKSDNLVIRKDFNAIDSLVRGYPSHGFVIDMEEASSLFVRVEMLDGELGEIAAGLGRRVIIPRSVMRDERPIVRFLDKAKGGQNGTASKAKASESEDAGKANKKSRSGESKEPTS